MILHLTWKAVKMCDGVYTLYTRSVDAQCSISPESRSAAGEPVRSCRGGTSGESMCVWYIVCGRMSRLVVGGE